MYVVCDFLQSTTKKFPFDKMINIYFNKKHQVVLKNSYDDVISAAADFYDQWDPIIATWIENNVCGL